MRLKTEATIHLYPEQVGVYVIALLILYLLIMGSRGDE